MHLNLRLASLSLLLACGSQPSPGDYLNQLSARGQVTGAVLVARDGKVLVSQGYGMADAEHGIANTVNTRFRIGSVTKQFTAMGILILQEQGKLAVQDSICKYLAGCPAAWQPITITELLTQSSAIADYTNFDDFPSLIGMPATVENLIDRFRSSPLAFTPGTRWSYSNSGYVLLGAIIERVSGQGYAEFLNQAIFAPLGMAQTGYDANSPPLGEHATGYLSPGVKPVFIDMSEFYAAGALYSTVGDLYLWDRALRAGKLVSAQALQAMMTAQIACPSGGCALRADTGYGYGWFIAAEYQQRYVYHWGRIDGFKSSNGFYPDGGVSIIVLSNLETTDVFGISLRLGQLALGAAGGPAAPL